jgi:hypothetical protein
MVRNFQRIYLYLMCIALLSFVSYACFTLLDFTFNAGARYSPITGLDAMKFAVSLLIVALLVFFFVGGLHYWWIRRDMALDAEAATGSVRAILLNLVQGIAGAFALFAGLITFLQASTPVSQYAEFLATMLVAVVGFVLLQVERGRTRAAAGVPIGAQRTQISLMLVVTLLTLFAAWMVAAMPLFAGRTAQIGDWVGLAWVAAFQVFYIVLARGDTASLRQLSALLLSFEVGLILTAVGVGTAADWLLRGLFDVPKGGIPPATPPAIFVPLLIFGPIVMIGYARWLLSEASHTDSGSNLGIGLGL